MVGVMFIWLGAGRARRRKVGDAGRLLDEAARGGLPVPAGAILLDEFFRLAQTEGLAVEYGGHATIADPELLYNTLIHSVRLPRFRRPVSVRAVRDDEVSESATALTSHPFIDFDDPAAAAGALAAAWSAFGQEDARRDVLIAERVEARHAGVAVMEADSENDLIRYADGPAGEAVLSLPRLRRGSRSAEALPPFGRRLQQLLRGARRTLGADDWLVEWADDGYICWLVGVQRLLPSNFPR